MIADIQIVDVEQGSQEWLSLRKTKITATDAAVIMGISPWKTPLQLYHEKLSNDPPMRPNERMQRGIDLEPIAREMFHIKTNAILKMEPKVIVKDWLMASLDGINAFNEILEIKCPGEKDHMLALSGIIPEYYFPQLQHQMYVADSNKVFYFSFDGFDGVILVIERDDVFIKKMLIEEKKFYDCLMNRTPPEPTEFDYIERSDIEWASWADQYKTVSSQIKELEQVEQKIRSKLISIADGKNTKGYGISLCQVNRKGNIDYNKIPELKNVDLEKYRKNAIQSWRLSM